MITADKVFKGNTEIVKIFKGLNLEWEKVLPIPSADDYVLDGLVFLLDGIDKGNVDGAWVDRIGGKQLTLNDCIVNSDNIEFKGVSTSYALYNLKVISTKYNTIEAVFISENMKGIIFISGRITRLEFYTRKEYTKYKIMAGTQLTPCVNPNLIHIISAPLSGNPIVDLVAQSKTYAYLIGEDSDPTQVGSSNFKGKIYSIRVYNRSLTSTEMLKNLMIDILRFNIPGYETVNLTIEGDDGKPMTGARFAILGNQYVYDGNPITLKVPKGTYYQIDFSCVPDYTACEFLGTYIAEENNIRNLKAIYTYDGWGDYFVSNKSFTDSIEEVRDGVTYYKTPAASCRGLMITGDVNIYHYPNNENFYMKFGDTGSSTYAVTKFESVPHIFTGTFTGGSYWGINNSFSNPAISTTFDNFVSLNMLFQLNGIKYEGTARRYYSLNSHTGGAMKLQSVKNYIDAEVGKARGLFSYSKVSHINNLLISPKSDTDLTGIFDIKIQEVEVDKMSNLLQNIYTPVFDISYVQWTNREGLIESLITNSFDRSQFGTDLTATIKLNTYAKALLTDTDIALITNKGYTIA